MVRTAYARGKDPGAVGPAPRLGGLLCDRGRFGYDFVNSPVRIRHPLVARDGATVPVTRELLRGRIVEPDR